MQMEFLPVSRWVKFPLLRQKVKILPISKPVKIRLKPNFKLIL